MKFMILSFRTPGKTHTMRMFIKRECCATIFMTFFSFQMFRKQISDRRLHKAKGFVSIASDLHDWQAEDCTTRNFSEIQQQFFNPLSSLQWEMPEVCWCLQVSGRSQGSSCARRSLCVNDTTYFPTTCQIDKFSCCWCWFHPERH